MSVLPVELVTMIMGFSDPLTLLEWRSCCKMTYVISQDHKVWTQSAHIHVSACYNEIQSIGHLSDFPRRIIGRFKIRSACLSSTADQQQKVSQLCPHKNMNYSFNIKANMPTLQPISLRSDYLTNKFLSLMKLANNKTPAEVSDQLSIHSLSTGETLGLLSEQGDIQLMFQFKHDINSYLLTIDRTRALRIYNLSEPPVSRVHRIQLSSTLFIHQGYLFPNTITDTNQQTQRRTPPARRRRHGELPDEYSFKELFNESEMVLSILSNRNTLTFYPIWFDALDRGPYGGVVTYPLIEKTVYFSLQIPTDLQVTAYWCISITEWRSWLIVCVLEDQSILIGRLDEGAGEGEGRWGVCLLNGRSDGLRNREVGPVLCVDEGSRLFLNLYDTGINGFLYTWSLRGVVDALMEDSLKETADVLKVDGKLVIPLVVCNYHVSWDHCLILVNGVDEDHKSQIVSVDLLTGSKGVVMEDNSARFKEMVFAADTEGGNPTILLKDDSGHIEIRKLGINAEVADGSTDGATIKSGKRKEQSVNQIAEWIDKLDF